MEENKETKEETTTTTTEEVVEPTPEQVADAMDAALNEAVESVGGEKKAKVEGEGEGKGEGKGEGEGQGEGKAKEDDKSTVQPQPQHQPDLSEERALFERGIKAGLSIEDLTAIPTHAMAEKIVAMAEKSAGIVTNKKGEGEGDGSPADDLAKALEEMKNDGEYDPKILGLLEGLYKENQTLKKAGQTADRDGFLKGQFASLDENVRSHVDAVHLAKLKSKFDMLEAGYKAKGADVSREDVFREAAQLALGDLMGKAAEERKAAALEQRKNIRLARPGGEVGQVRRNGPATEEDVASELWDQLTQS